MVDESTPDAVSALVAWLRRSLPPDARVAVDPPLDKECGVWSVDVDVGEVRGVVEWWARIARAGAERPYGLSVSRPGERLPFSGCDETVATAEQAARRVAELVRDRA